MNRHRLWASVLLGILISSGCPRRFDPRAQEVRAASPAAEADYQRAHNLLQEGKDAAARAALQRFSAEHPQDPLAERARFLRGMAEYRLKDYGAAREQLLPFADQIVDSEEGTELHAVLADLLRREGRVREALREYDRYYHGASVRPVEQAYVRAEVLRLLPALPPEEQAGLRQRFGLGPLLLPAAAPAPATAIGLLLPLSGRDRALGERVLRGALLGADLLPEHKAEGFELRVRDLGAAGVSAEQAVDELAQEGVAALVGPPSRGGEAERVAAQAAKHGLPLLDLSPELAAVPGPAFHVLRGNAARAEGLARYLAAQRLPTVAVLAPATAYGRAMTRAFVAALQGRPAANVRVVAQLSYPEGTTTFLGQAQKLLALAPEALFVPAPVGQLELVSAQLASSGVLATQNVPAGRTRPSAAGGPPVRLLLSTAEGLSERLLRNAGRYLQGAVLAPISSGAIPVDDPALGAFAAGYQRAYGEEPVALDALGHDAVRLLRAACGPAADHPARECAPQQVARALPDLVLGGATGPVCFDAAGQRAGTPLLLRIEGTALRLLPPPKTETCGAPELRGRTARLL